MSIDEASRDQRSQRERMLAGDLYIADDPELARDSQRAMRLMAAYNASPADPPQERQAILTELLGSVGVDSAIRPPLYCDYGYNIHIGARTFCNFGLMALNVAVIQHRRRCPDGSERSVVDVDAPPARVIRTV